PTPIQFSGATSRKSASLAPSPISSASSPRRRPRPAPVRFARYMIRPPLRPYSCFSPPHLPSASVFLSAPQEPSLSAFISPFISPPHLPSPQEPSCAFSPAARL